MKYCIGVDGGGTKTLTYLGDMAGNILDNHVFGPSNYYSSGLENTKDVFGRIVNYYCRKHQFDYNDLVFISLGLAGVDREMDKQVIRNIFLELNIACDIMVYNDARTALVGALGKDEGIIVVSGTGSIATGIRDNQLVRAGGWGHILADEGSGYDIGMKTLITIMKSYDGRLSSTLMTEKAIEFLELEGVEDIIGFIHDPNTDKKRIAEVSIVAVQAAKENDALALAILDQSVEALLQLANAVIRKLYSADESAELTYIGGIITNVDYIRDSFISEIEKKHPNLTIKKPAQDGAVGALYLGWNKYGVLYQL
ncbi:MAG: BadF/BadG/BcrA/BcrD ATPase family protein [Eubacteriales bacterium]|nr:BadF/BadG/BcrA/BcrD ATPase family protein [Eubacteriales bacterium]